VDLTVGGRTFSQPFQSGEGSRLTFTDADRKNSSSYEEGDDAGADHARCGGFATCASAAEDLVAQRRRTGRTRLRWTGRSKNLNDTLYPIEERLVQFRARRGDLITTRRD